MSEIGERFSDPGSAYQFILINKLLIFNFERSCLLLNILSPLTCKDINHVEQQENYKSGKIQSSINNAEYSQNTHGSQNDYLKNGLIHLFPNHTFKASKALICSDGRLLREETSHSSNSNSQIDYPKSEKKQYPRYQTHDAIPLIN